MILPSAQTVTEPLFYKIAPNGIAFFTSRVLIRGSVITDHVDMEREAFRAGRELSTTGINCIAYCCTGSGILQGIDGDREFCLRMEKGTGIPTTSTLSAVLEGLKVLRLKKLVVITPYQEAMHKAEESFFSSQWVPSRKEPEYGNQPRDKTLLGDS